jgi:hypothetical protein
MAIDIRSPDQRVQPPLAFDPGVLAVGTPLPISWSGLRRELARALRSHAIVILIVLAHMAAAILLPPLFGVSIPYSPTTYITTVLTLTAVAAGVFLLVYAAVVAITVKPERLLPYVVTEVTGKMLTAERLAVAAVTLMLFPIFAASFSYFKVAVPAFHPFEWDARLAAWDRKLHGGHQPWELLQPILGHPLVTTGVNAAYHMWFGVTYAVVLWMMVETRRPQLRMRYLLTFVLTWILLGNLGATLFSSAGPAYFGRVTGLDDPFAPLMAYLHAANAVAPVSALEIQDLLWGWYRSGAVVAGAGISAMPSVHVGIAFSCFLLGRAFGRRLAALGGLFAGVILVGSVHLGWHYAIDGYAAILATWFIWRGVGWLLARRVVARLLWGEPSPAAASPALA